MQFIVDSDTGDRINGWVGLDNPLESARVLVFVPGRDVISVNATDLRQDVADAALHVTGRCGFHIDETTIPDLRRLKDIELREASTNLLMHRRFNSSAHIARRVLLLDASVLPPRGAHASLRRHFATPYFEVESLTYETLFSLVRMHQSVSLLLCGRPSFTRQVSGFEEKNYVIAALLRDPFEDLAERLLFVNLLANSKNPAPIIQYATGLHALADFAKNVNFENPKSLTEALRGLSHGHKALLRDPMTRMLACEPEETAKRSHLTQALNNLSRFHVVGTRSRFPPFLEILTEVLGVNIFGDAYAESSTRVLSLAAKLAEIGSARNLLEQDLQLYSDVEEAFDIGYTAVGQPS